MSRPGKSGDDRFALFDLTAGEADEEEVPTDVGAATTTTETDVALQHSPVADATEADVALQEHGDEATSEADATDAGVADDAAESAATPTPVWESLPVGGGRRRARLIVTAAGTYTPSGRELTGPVDSVEKLDKLIRWASLTPLGAPPQMWVVGQVACEALVIRAAFADENDGEGVL